MPFFKDTNGSAACCRAHATALRRAVRRRRWFEVDQLPPPPLQIKPQNQPFCVVANRKLVAV